MTERQIVELRPEGGPLLKTLAEVKNAPFPELAINYTRTWANSGIDIGASEALRKISLFNPNYIYIFSEPATGELLGQIHTVPVFTGSLENFIRQYRTYKAVERKATDMTSHPHPNFIICFSLNCKPGYFIKSDEKIVPLPKFILENLPAPESAYKIGFSFINMLRPTDSDADSLMKRYRELIRLENTRLGGPAMMHEAFGGIVVAFLPNARPEHKLAAGGITLVVYPRGAEEAKIFKEIKEERRRTKELPFRRYPDTIILNDVSLQLKPMPSLS